MSAPIFPDEPIRMPTPREMTPREAEDDAALDELDDPDERTCWTCGGDGITECDGGSCDGISDQCYRGAHLRTCPNCRGSGAAKDVWYW